MSNLPTSVRPGGGAPVPATANPANQVGINAARGVMTNQPKQRYPARPGMPAGGQPPQNPPTMTLGNNIGMAPVGVPQYPPGMPVLPTTQRVMNIPGQPGAHLNLPGTSAVPVTTTVPPGTQPAFGRHTMNPKGTNKR